MHTFSVHGKSYYLNWTSCTDTSFSLIFLADEFPTKGNIRKYMFGVANLPKTYQKHYLVLYQQLHGLNNSISIQIQ